MWNIDQNIQELQYLESQRTIHFYELFSIQNNFQENESRNTIWWFCDIFESSLNLLYDSCNYYLIQGRLNNKIRLSQLSYMKSSLEILFWSYNSLLDHNFWVMNTLSRSVLENIFRTLWLSFYSESLDWLNETWFEKKKNSFNFSSFLKKDLNFWDEKFWYHWKSQHAHWNTWNAEMHYFKATKAMDIDKQYLKIWIEWWINYHYLYLWCMFYIFYTFFLNEKEKKSPSNDIDRWILLSIDLLESLFLWARENNSKNKFLDYVLLFKGSTKLCKDREISR